MRTDGRENKSKAGKNSVTKLGTTTTHRVLVRQQVLANPKEILAVLAQSLDEAFLW